LKSTRHGYGARKHIPPFSFSTFAQAIAVGRFPGRMVFFSAGRNHHDLAVMAVGPDAPSPSDNAEIQRSAKEIGKDR